MNHTLTQLRDKLAQLRNVERDSRVVALTKTILDERRPQIENLQSEINARLAKNSSRKKTPRWPENTPPSVLDHCKRYWQGSDEYHKFRIHLWNDKAIWTSWPKGGYSDNGGFHPAPATYFLISTTKSEQCLGNSRPKVLQERESTNDARVTKKAMQEALDKL